MNLFIRYATDKSSKFKVNIFSQVIIMFAILLVLPAFTDQFAPHVKKRLKVLLYYPQ